MNPGAPRTFHDNRANETVRDATFNDSQGKRENRAHFQSFG